MSAACARADVLVDPYVTLYVVAAYEASAGAFDLDVDAVDVLAVRGRGDVEAVLIGAEAGFVPSVVIKGYGDALEVDVSGDEGHLVGGAGVFELYVGYGNGLGLVGAVLVDAEDLVALYDNSAVLHSAVETGAEDVQRDSLADVGVGFLVFGSQLSIGDFAVLEEAGGVGDGRYAGVSGELSLGPDDVDKLAVIGGGDKLACLFGAAAVDDILEGRVLQHVLILCAELYLVLGSRRFERRLDIVGGVFALDVHHDESAVVDR